jgi:hypothetical protein
VVVVSVVVVVAVAAHCPELLPIFLTNSEHLQVDFSPRLSALLCISATIAMWIA